jgi:DNA-binding LytR/AlgR family response regulator
MRVFIAEDEPPARERLVETLARVAPDAVVLGHSDSVRRTADWLATHPPPDLLLLDIQLADGLSLDLFRAQREQGAQLPVVFTTAYDRFALDAFQALAVDYLLKPVGDAALAAALAKVSRWRAHFAATDATAPPAWPQRLACRRWGGGAQYVALPVARLARLVSLDKLTHADALDGTRFQVEQTLAELEQALDPARFFRLNRQVLVAASAVRHYAPVGKGRLAVVLAPDDELVTVTQERAAAFKLWWARAPVA